MLMVFGSIWQKVKSGMSSGKTLRTMSSFRGRTNSPKDLLDNVGSGPLEKRRLAAMPELQLLKWDFFQRRKGVTLRSTSIEAVLNGGTGVIFYCFFGHIFPHSGTKTIAMFTSIHAAKKISKENVACMISPMGTHWLTSSLAFPIGHLSFCTFPNFVINKKWNAPVI